MEALPAELTIDILLRLPVKTIIHCKCVCKTWRNLVLDPFFVNFHLSRSPIGLIIHNKCRRDFTNYDPGILQLVEIEDKVDHHRLNYDNLLSLDLNLAPTLQNTLIHHMESVNGLICIWPYSPEHDNTYICNPITREYMILPGHIYLRQSFMIVAYGFGVNLLTGDYKVVRTWNVLPNDDKLSRPSVLEAEVYTLGTGHWRSLGNVPYRLSFRFKGTFLNNHCHWVVLSDKEDASEKLCTFDFDKETFQLFPSPPSESVQRNQLCYHSLAALKSCLCKLDIYDSELIFWVMKEYGIKKSWHKDVVIKLGISDYLDWWFWVPTSLIVALKDERILIVVEEKLWEFHPRNGTLEDTKMFHPNLSAVSYRPSFLKLQNFESEEVRMF